MLPHASKIGQVLESVDSSLTGLKSFEVEKRLKQYGRNELDEEKTNYFLLFLSQFKSPVIYILMIAAFLSYFIGEKNDFYIIIFVILTNSVIGFWMEVKAEFSVNELKKLTQTQMTVIRDKKNIEIPSSELVPGDIVFLSEGDIIAADIRLIESVNLSIDESSITGESLPSEKDAEVVLKDKTLPYELKNMALSGTMVVKGKGKGVVVKTGKNTYFAGVAEKALEKSPQSPLTKALGIFLKRYVAFIFLSLFIISLTYFYLNRTFQDLIYTLLALLVSAIPEGLPIVLTLVLAVGSLILSRKNVLVRHLPAVETLGSTTVIASDKTGTITEGVLAVKKFFAKNEEELKIVSALCNDADEKKGDPVDKALLKWLGKDYYEIRNKNQQIGLYSFDIKRKSMATINNYHGKPYFFIKGAFEELVKNCTNKDVKALEKAHDSMAENGLRVLAFGIGDSPCKDILETKIRIVGVIGFIDPPKHGVKEAVSIAKKAGIRVLMITGDNRLTAKAIAKEVGIFEEGDTVLTGEEIDALNNEELELKLKKTTVLARVLPEHKYKVVKILQKSEIVAVTGDGVNDVPALRAADLGIAMGSGSQAAKSASKMILVDSNLKVITNAVREGRIIADNIKKVIHYLLVSSMSQILLIFFSIILNLPLPLYPLQILWINLVGDGVQDKTFPFIKEEGNVMARHPKKIDQLFFDKDQVMRIVFSTAIIASVNLILFIYMLGRYRVDVAITSVFVSMVFSQWINGIFSQKESEPFFKNLKYSFTINKFIWVGIMAGIILQLIPMFLLRNWFKTTPLSFEQYAPIAISLILIFMILETVRWILYITIRQRKQKIIQ